MVEAEEVTDKQDVWKFVQPPLLYPPTGGPSTSFIRICL
jgi:hypothetical protein